MTLTDFLLARIAEDEQVAQATSETPGALEWTSDWPLAVGLAGPVGGPRGYDSIVVDPARLLAECEAKRQIVSAMRERHPHYNRLQANPDAIGEDRMHALACRFLALPYADHPDYREEWKP